MTTSVGSKQKLIENSFDICTTKFKLDIFAFLFSWPVNPIDFDTLLMRGRPQAEAGRQFFIYLVQIYLCIMCSIRGKTCLCLPESLRKNYRFTNLKLSHLFINVSIEIKLKKFFDN